jgi:hypothetical protein
MSDRNPSRRRFVTVQRTLANLNAMTEYGRIRKSAGHQASLQGRTSVADTLPSFTLVH